ncbi:hypothetical protein SAMN06297358_2591 [Pedobacter xixiisoli]|uniref:Uncharacterized protein n=1 Tax=Pedobacter xixiisoli TaxID=1476464 RepID=A0A286A6Q9_9SPHI|nr:hypothetical protein [Pedobacter xixiisoli]SOD17603.1 hypothetical protein SAMN06297358_2591 [Pedobacter xixiisoli]
MEELVSKNYLSLYWGGAMIGRFVGAISLNHTLSQAKKNGLHVGYKCSRVLVNFQHCQLKLCRNQFLSSFIAMNLLLS